MSHFEGDADGRCLRRVQVSFRLFVSGLLSGEVHVHAHAF